MTSRGEIGRPSLYICHVEMSVTSVFGENCTHTACSTCALFDLTHLSLEVSSVPDTRRCTWRLLLLAAVGMFPFPLSTDAATKVIQVSESCCATSSGSRYTSS